MRTNKRDPRDAPSETYGKGLPLTGLLCSRCNNKVPAKGGGFVRGRWYGACCKPKKESARGA